MSDKSIADGTWTCPYCGAWNAVWLNECGRCQTKITDDEKSI